MTKLLGFTIKSPEDLRMALVIAVKEIKAGVPVKDLQQDLSAGIHPDSSVTSIVIDKNVLMLEEGVASQDNPPPRC